MLDLDQREVIEAVVILGRPLAGGHPDQQCSLHDHLWMKLVVVHLQRVGLYLGVIATSSLGEGAVLVE
jgi:hypothetical protein